MANEARSADQMAFLNEVAQSEHHLRHPAVLPALCAELGLVFAMEASRCVVTDPNAPTPESDAPEGDAPTDG